MPNPEAHMAEIKRLCGDDIQGMTATIQVPAMVMIPFNGKYVTKQINLIGIDEKTYAEVGDFSNFLLHPGNREKLAFHLREKGFDNRFEDGVGWPWRRKARRRRKIDARTNAHIEEWEAKRLKELQGAKVEIKAADRTSQDKPLKITLADVDSSTTKKKWNASTRRRTSTSAACSAFKWSRSAAATPTASSKIFTWPSRATTCIIALAQRGHAAEADRRQVHGRRPLRKQNERVRRDPRLRPARASCKNCEP